MSSADDLGFKAFRHGTHRVVSPAETVGKVRPVMSKMGITRVANVTGLDSIGIPVVMVCRPNARSLSVSQGKGMDLDAATASGLMESVESYHAERVALPLKLASYNDLRRTAFRVLDVGRMPFPPDSVFHPDLELLWVEGHDLLQSEPVWVPYEMVHTNYTLPFPTGSGCFWATSNGLASGNHPLEAISHGICEVVERAAHASWNGRTEASQRGRRIDLDTVKDPACRDVLHKYERAGVAVAAWEMTTNVGIPSFLCTIVDRMRDPLRPLYTAGGMGSHPVRAVALLRALTEAAQSRLTVISGARDDVFRGDYEESRDSAVPSAFRRQMEEERPTRDFRDGACGWSGETFREDVAWELERLRSTGIEHVIAVDLTKPEFRLPVTRVIIPGLDVSSGPGGLPGGDRA